MGQAKRRAEAAARQTIVTPPAPRPHFRPVEVMLDDPTWEALEARAFALQTTLEREGKLPVNERITPRSLLPGLVAWALEAQSEIDRVTAEQAQASNLVRLAGGPLKPEGMDKAAERLRALKEGR